MTLHDKVELMVIVLYLNGCALLPPSLISIHGAPTDDLSRVAQLSEDSEHPLLLRGLDRVPLETMRVPSAFQNYAYLVKAGRHIFWLMSVPHGHPLLPQKMRCYAMDVDLAGGVRYRLEEDVDEKRALLLRDDTEERLAFGRMVDEAWVFQRSCRWQ